MAERFNRKDKIMQKRFLLAPVLCLSFALAACSGGGDQGQGGPPSLPVTVSQPLVRDVTEWDDFVGRFEAIDEGQPFPVIVDYAHTPDALEKVLVALEQLRWLPSELGSPRVWINQPAFTASYIEGEMPVLSMRAVVGKTTNQTSFFYDEIEQIDYNPYWGVPQSIIVNEMLPRLRRDPDYLDRSGYEVFDAKGNRIPSSAVDWSAYGSKVPFAVRQTPSEANALGELKILFPNKHAIYMHDTPQKQFFDRDMRALSHGCIRLQDPRGMAARVLGRDRDYIAGKLAQGHSLGQTPRIPVYVSYFTAWPVQNGSIEYFPDVYKRDDRLRAALASTEAARNPDPALAQSDG